MAEAERVEVLVTIPFPDALVQKIRDVSPQLHVTVKPVDGPKEISSDLWAKTEILYTDFVLPEPDQVPRLKWIQFDYAGVEFLRDSAILEKSDVVLTTLSGASMPQIAEFVLTMMLSLGHHLYALFSHQMNKVWPEDKWSRFQPFELRGCTVGIVGYGSIGREVARLLVPLGVKVLAAKKNVMHPQDAGYSPEGLGDPNGDLFQRLYPIQAVRSMLRECDFVVITLPLTDETMGLIGKEELAALKPSAYLVDVSRGGIVDQKALLEALKDGRLAGAALDVFPREPLPEDSPLWQQPNVIITPHIAGASASYKERAVALFAENLERYLNGIPLYNRYDPQKGY